MMEFQVDRQAVLPKLPGKLAWQTVSTGESGDKVYRRSDGVAYAKVATGVRIEALQAEYLRTEWLASQGVGSAQVLEWIKSDTEGCLVTSCVPGIPAGELSPDDLLRAWPSIAEKVFQLHRLSTESCPFERRLSSVMQTAADVVGRQAVNREFLQEADQDIPFDQLLDSLQSQLSLRLMQERSDLVVCHGDACMPNIMVDPVTLQCKGFIDLGRLGIADRYQDLALLIGNTRETWVDERQAEKALDILWSTHKISFADSERLSFYLRLDPLTWE